jgi:hypothetical protein
MVGKRDIHVWEQSQICPRLVCARTKHGYRSPWATGNSTSGFSCWSRFVEPAKGVSFTLAKQLLVPLAMSRDGHSTLGNG